MKVVNIDGENLLNGLRNYNNIFKKDGTYYKVKRHKKPGLHSLSRIYIFEKITEDKGEKPRPCKG